jgi:hypothetical protein
MPWKIIEADGGYYVITVSTKRRHSNKPMTKAKAQAQLRALQANADKKGTLIAKGPLDKYRRRNNTLY